MNVTLEKLDAVNAKIIVNVEEADYQSKVADELKKLGRTHALPGFRKGHVPFGQLQKRFGKQMTSDVINQEVYKAVTDYLKDNKINILGEPIPVEVKELDLENQKDFTFEYEIGIAPEINVDLNKDITLPFYTIEVSDDMMKDQDKMFTERFGSQEPVAEFEEKALVKGALLELNADGTPKTEDAIEVANAIVAPFRFSSKDEAAKFNGKKVGDKVVFNPWNSCNGELAELASMLHIDREKAAETKADFELTISEMIGIKPAEHNEEFFKNVFGADVTTEEQYQDMLRKNIEAQLLPNSSALFQRDAREMLMNKFSSFELPAEFLKKWLVRQNDGLTDENIAEEYTKLEPQFKWQLIKERVAAAQNVQITDEDLLNYATHIAARQFAQYGMTNMDEETLQTYAKNLLGDKQYRPYIIEQVGDAKLFEAIHNAVTVDEKKVSLDEFKKVAEAAQ